MYPALSASCNARHDTESECAPSPFRLPSYETRRHSGSLLGDPYCAPPEPCPSVEISPSYAPQHDCKPINRVGRKTLRIGERVPYRKISAIGLRHTVDHQEQRVVQHKFQLCCVKHTDCAQMYTVSSAVCSGKFFMSQGWRMGQRIACWSGNVRTHYSDGGRI